MSRSFAGKSHCVLSCGDQAASDTGTETQTKDLSATRDVDRRPVLVSWEMTQACDLKCAQCRLNSRPHRHPLELSTAEAFHLIDEIATMKVPLLVLTGGDPLKRPDLYPVVQYAHRRRVRTSLTPSTTPLLVRDAVVDLQQSGLSRLALGLDASTPELHDAIRGVAGSYKRSLDAVDWCHEAGLAIEINTTISRRNLADLEKLVGLIAKLRVDLWKVFFLVPTGRAQAEDLLTADEHEEVFVKLYEASKSVKFEIRTSEGPHYQRYILQQRALERRDKPQGEPSRDLTDGKCCVFVSHTGEVFPSGFMPLSAGNVLWEPLSEIYMNSALFRALRDSSQLKGKCGRCEFKEVCGGSRARAYAVARDPLVEEPCCAYVPA